jgi:hypothetical protein
MRLKENVAHEFCADNSSPRPQFPKRIKAPFWKQQTHDERTPGIALGPNSAVTKSKSRLKIESATWRRPYQPTLPARRFALDQTRRSDLGDDLRSGSDTHDEPAG